LDVVEFSSVVNFDVVELSPVADFDVELATICKTIKFDYKG
jgi:arginase family enzyme